MHTSTSKDSKYILQLITNFEILYSSRNPTSTMHFYKPAALVAILAATSAAAAPHDGAEIE